MDKDKQIDMITELLIDFDEMGFAPTTLCPDPEAYAVEWRKKLTEELKGYRKASEVAREIFEEIENALELLQRGVKEGRKNDGIKYQQLHDGRILSIEAIKYFTAELKKKYTESEDTE